MCRLFEISFEDSNNGGLGNVPSGKSPLAPFIKCLPRYHPSPKSSSRSISSTLSPLSKLSSSELRAEKSSECIELVVWKMNGFALQVRRTRGTGLTLRFHLDIIFRPRSSPEHDHSMVKNAHHLRMTIRIWPGSGLPCSGLAGASANGLDAILVLILGLLRSWFRQGPGIFRRKTSEGLAVVFAVGFVGVRCVEN